MIAARIGRETCVEFGVATAIFVQVRPRRMTMESMHGGQDMGGDHDQ
ncbi:MAG TPA: hypothetical protein VHU19_15040 [Pyrinomonadaceae bacterium]|jgi:hypothetical protein|nr:hypothetical protein [Pyrinomonadaceae bacterium]